MLQLFRRLTRQEALLLLVSVGLVFLGVVLDVEVPSYMSEITTLLQTEGTSVADILSPGFKMIGLSLASFVMAVAVGFIAARVAASFTTRLREQIFSQVMAYSQAEIKGFSIPSLLTRTTNDLTQLQVLITMGLQVVTKGPIMAIWAMGKIAGKNDQWLLATTVAVVTFILMAAVLLLLAFPKQSVAQGLTDKLNSITREILTGIRVVRAYNAEDYEDKKFAQANEEVTQLNLYIGRLMTIFNPSMTLISGGLTLAIYWIGSSLINDAQATDKILVFSDMIVFASYAMQVIIGFMLMIAVFFILPRALVSSKRIKEVLNLSSSIQFPEQTVAVAEGQGLLEFEDVSFRYSKTSEAVIEHVTFKALPGQTVAFIGSTGSGKSTLVNLIPRFYDATQGLIKLDGRPLKSYSQEELSQKVGYIPQKAVLFSGTVKSNMTMGLTGDKSLTDSQIWEALELAQAKTFVQEKEAGLETEVAQGGSNFSGGQRQRLAIARALARKPEILIFDDSFSALDYKTDKVLRAALKAETHQMTKLIVAQRISTIMDADHILVLDQGKVVGQGTHQELLASNPVYQEIAYSQLSEEELAHGN